MVWYGVLDRRNIPEGGHHGNKMCQILCSACTLKAICTDVLFHQRIHDFAILYCREHVSKSLEYVRRFTHILSQSIQSSFISQQLLFCFFHLPISGHDPHLFTCSDTFFTFSQYTRHERDGSSNIGSFMIKWLLYKMSKETNMMKGSMICYFSDFDASSTHCGK